MADNYNEKYSTCHNYINSGKMRSKGWVEATFEEIMVHSFQNWWKISVHRFKNYYKS